MSSCIGLSGLDVVLKRCNGIFLCENQSFRTLVSMFFRAKFGRYHRFLVVLRRLRSVTAIAGDAIKTLFSLGTPQYIVFHRLEKNREFLAPLSRTFTHVQWLPDALSVNRSSQFRPNNIMDATHNSYARRKMWAVSAE